jgi:hypothetical protein
MDKKDKEKLIKQKQKEKLKKQKEKEKLKKQKDKEKLKKLKEKEKLKKQKEKEKEKEKLKKLKEKEKLKKLKEKEKLKKQKEKRKIRKKIYKGGEVTTRKQKKFIHAILSSWKREDDADDYFEMWKSHFDKNTSDIFIILNYNCLTELQKIKDLIHEEELSQTYSFRDIMNRIKSYSFLSLLAETINSQDIDDNTKKLQFIKILKNLINTYILLTQNIFNETVFPQIGELTNGKPTFLYRSWRNNDQLESMKSLNMAWDLSTSPIRKKQKTENVVTEDILITDNYLSTSRSKELALKFYKNSFGGEIKEFILWKIEIPSKYPFLHVSSELEEVLLHVGAKLKKTSTTYHEQAIDGIPGFKYTEVTYKYTGYDQYKIDEIIDKYKRVVEIFSKVSGIYTSPSLKRKRDDI